MKGQAEKERLLVIGPFGAARLGMAVRGGARDARRQVILPPIGVLND
jgi:hypothetical protein